MTGAVSHTCSGIPAAGRLSPPLKFKMTDFAPMTCIPHKRHPITHSERMQETPPLITLRLGLYTHYPPSESPHIYRERYSYGSPAIFLLSSAKMAPCFSCGPRTPSQPLVHVSLAPKAVSTQPTLCLSPEQTSRASVSSPTPCWSAPGCYVLGGGTRGLHSSLFALPSSVQLLHFSLRF